MKISNSGEVQIFFSEEFLITKKEEIDKKVLAVKLMSRTNVEPNK
jgi:hypothetical protein